jgi:hypothetical protein
MESTISQDIDRFVYSIDSLDLSLRLSLDALSIKSGEEEKLLNEFSREIFSLISSAQKKNEPDKGETPEDVKQVQSLSEEVFSARHRFNDLTRQLERVNAASLVVPRSFLVALVSQFDAFVGDFLKSLFISRPELLEASERTLTFSELSKFGSLERAREYILEKEVETLLRKSHIEQFAWLEKKFGISLRAGLSIWPTFIELTERRNLYVHTAGRVSSQYLEVCKSNEVNEVISSEIKVGDELMISDHYFKNAHAALYEIGVKLGQVLWRKLLPSQAADADSHLTNIIVSLLKDGSYDLATVLSEFANCTFKKRFSSERYRLVFLVNNALAYYLKGDKKGCEQILSQQDWSALSGEFKLAEQVLKEQFDSATDIIKKIGRNSTPRKGDYLYWPLFTEFRKTEQFRTALRDVFGEDIGVETASILAEVPKLP